MPFGQILVISLEANQTHEELDTFGVLITREDSFRAPI